MKCLIIILLAGGALAEANQGCEGGSATITVRQTWFEEPHGYNRTALVLAPKGCLPHKKFPVVFDLHGAGGRGTIRRLGKYFKNKAVLVAPNGYNKHWNVHGHQKSKAPDTEFLVALIAKVGETYPQADMNDVTIVGTSNGAGMINRLLIEVPAPRPFHRVVPMVSTLGKFQYHDDSFWTRSDETSENLDVKIVPSKLPLKYMQFHGTKDGTIPYNGGHGVGQEFYSAQEATYIWASYWGETAAMLADDEGEVMENGIMVKYSYLGGKVVHYKIPGDNHGLGQSGGRAREIIKKEVLGL